MMPNAVFYMAYIGVKLTVSCREVQKNITKPKSFLFALVKKISYCELCFFPFFL